MKKSTRTYKPTPYFPKPDVLTEIIQSVAHAKRAAVKKGHDITFNSIIESILTQLTICYQAKELVYYSGWLNILRHDRDLLSVHINEKGSPSIYNFYRVNLAKWIMWRFNGILESASETEQQLLEAYPYLHEIILFFTHLVYEQMQAKDFETLTDTVKAVKKMIRENRVFESIELFESDKDFNFELEKETQTTRHRLRDDLRMLLIAGYYWAIFLFSEEKINSEEFHQFQKIFQLPEFHFEQYFHYLLHFKNIYYTDEKGWNRWDHEIRPLDETYSPPLSSDWTAYGFLVHLLQSDVKFFGTRKYEDKQLIESVLNELIQRLTFIQKDGYEKLQDILFFSSSISFSQKVEDLINEFNVLKKSNDRLTQLENINTEISAEIVRNFENTIINGFLDNNDVLKLFDQIGSVENVGAGNELSFVGTRNYLLKREFFLAGKNTPVFGIERIGSDVAEHFQDRFLYEILRGQPVQEYDDEVEGLASTIYQLREKGINPSIIFVDQFLWFERFSDLNHPFYNPTGDHEWKTSLQGFMATFMDVPLVRLRSNIFSKSMIVADFNLAFSLKRQVWPQKDPAFIQCAISEIDQQRAEGFFKANPNGWLDADNNEEDALLKIRNYVALDFYLRVNFSVRNNEAFQIISILNEDNQRDH